MRWIAANAYTYDPYGALTASSGTAPNSLGYDGGNNTHARLILVGTRYYNPASATWTQPDPNAQNLATDPTRAAAYSFAGDDPINNIDPYGGDSILKRLRNVGKVVLTATAKVVSAVTSLTTPVPALRAMAACDAATDGGCAVATSEVVSGGVGGAADLYRAASGATGGGVAGVDLVGQGFGLAGLLSWGNDDDAGDIGAVVNGVSAAASALSSSVGQFWLGLG